MEQLRFLTGGQIIYATMGIPISRSQWPFLVFFKTTPARTVESVRENLKLSQPTQVCVRNGLFVVSPAEGTDVPRMLDSTPVSSRPELATAFEAVGSYPIQVLLLPPTYVRRTIEELMPQLPAQLGGGPSTLLTDGLSWAALGIDPAHPRAELIVQSTSEDAARKLAEQLPRLLQSLYDALPPVQTHLLPEMAKMLVSLVKPEVIGSRLSVRMDGQQIVENVRLQEATMTAVRATVEPRGNIRQFKQILVAMHNYHDVHKSFPPRNEERDDQGHSKLSWRVYILPFVEQTSLFMEFHLDEAWDSPHNKQLLEKMPDVYKSNALRGITGHEIKPGYTTFLAPVGDDTVFGGTKATRFQDIRDGASNTVVLVEVKPELAVPWTAPADYAFDSSAPAKGLRIKPSGRFLAAFADGAAEDFPGNLEARQLIGLFTKAKGEFFPIGV